MRAGQGGALMADLLRARLTSAGVALALAILIAAVFLRAYWRDEYIALYFSGRGMSLHDALTQRMVHDVHPPLYFVILHFWRAVAEPEIWARCFNFVALALGAAGVWLLGRKRPSETLLFLALCAGSYWVIFYSIEVRMYLMLFWLCAATVLVLRNALEAPSPRLSDAALFAAIGALASLSQFFGALWIAAAGLWMGLGYLREGKFSAFVLWGGASVLAIAPAAAWILYVRPDQNPVAAIPLAPLGNALYYSSEQFLRGLVVKTFGSNLAAAFVLFACLPALLRRRDRFDGLLALASITVVLVAFALQLFVVPMIKERAFIVVMPAVMYLIVRAIDLAAQEGRARRARALVPLFALISPLFFLGEYSKDREHFDEVRALVTPACAGQPVVAYNRESVIGPDFHALLTQLVLNGGGGDPVALDTAEMMADGVLAPASACPVRAVALAMPNGESVLHEEARTRFRALGVPIDDLQERSFGDGRQLVYVAREAMSSR